MANLVVFRDSSLVDVDEDLLPLKTHGYRLANLILFNDSSLMDMKEALLPP